MAETLEQIDARDIKLLSLLSASRREEIAQAVQMRNNFIKLFGLEAAGELFAGAMVFRQLKPDASEPYPYDGMA